MRVRTGVPGSGLGLAIVKTIAEQHQALITLGTRHRGPGLVVFLIFPRV
jgi:signal transduction histidine kinase